MIDDLYSARLLKLAANMPRAGRLAAPQGSAERVAKLCGSRIIVDVTLDEAGRIADFAQEVDEAAADSFPILDGVVVQQAHPR